MHETTTTTTTTNKSLRGAPKWRGCIQLKCESRLHAIVHRKTKLTQQKTNGLIPENKQISNKQQILALNSNVPGVPSWGGLYYMHFVV